MKRTCAYELGVVTVFEREKMIKSGTLAHAFDKVPAALAKYQPHMAKYQPHMASCIQP